MTVKDFMKHVDCHTLIQEEDETLTREEYVAKFGDKTFMGMWAIGENLIGIYFTD